MTFSLVRRSHRRLENVSLSRLERLRRTAKYMIAGVAISAAALFGAQTTAYAEEMPEPVAIEQTTEVETPVVEETYEAPVVEETYEAPVVEETYEAPVVEETYEAPVVEETYEAPVVEEVQETPEVAETTVAEVAEEAPVVAEVNQTEETQETKTFSSSYEGYSVYMQDGKLNVIGDITEDQYAKLNDTLTKQYGEDLPEVLLWTGLEQGENELGDTGTVVTVDENGNTTITGNGIEDNIDLNGNLEKIEDNEYVIAVDQDGNIHVISGNNTLESGDIENIKKLIAEKYPEYKDANIISDIDDVFKDENGNLNLDGMTVLELKQDDKLTEVFENGMERQKPVDTPPTPDEPTPPTPDKPTPPTPDKPTPPTPDEPTPETPETPTPETPETPAPETPVVNKGDLPQMGGYVAGTGNDVAQKFGLKGLSVLGLAGLGALALTRRKKYNLGLVEHGSKLEEVMLNGKTSKQNTTKKKVK